VLQHQLVGCSGSGTAPSCWQVPMLGSFSPGTAAPCGGRALLEELLQQGQWGHHPRGCWQGCILLV
jgi:hypothetical protein